MSQSDMPQDRRAASDLRGRALPGGGGEWGRPAPEEMFRWSERRACELGDWYLRRCRPRRRWAKGLRTAVAVFGAAGIALPVAELTGIPGAAVWGYGAVAMAVGCVGADRWLGLTSGWMRDMATALAVQRRLESFQYDWAAEYAREGESAGEVVERCMALMRRFSEDLAELVRAETLDWITEFRASMGRLGAAQAGVGAAATVAAADAADAGRRGGWRVPESRGLRPNMPRQRPPEGPL